MAIKIFADGSQLITGDDLYNFLLQGHRYERNCQYCHWSNFENSDECINCSGMDDVSCSCHIVAPCSKCVDNSFQLAKNIIDYWFYEKGLKSKQSIKINLELYNQYKDLNEEWFFSYEVLNTKEKAFYASKDKLYNDPYDDEIIEIFKPDTYIKICIEKIVKIIIAGYSEYPR